MTVLEVIQRSADFLAKKGVDAPRLQVELLLAHLLKLPRMKLYLNFDRTLTAGELDQLRALVQRRGLREPLQHIIGSTSFCGLEMRVSNQTLIPRPETELLAEAGWEFLKARPDKAPSALDFGTGTGCLAITLCVKAPNATVSAVDISASALAMARQNATEHQVTERLHFFEGDGFAALPAQRFDLIVSNPPYIPREEIETLDPEVRDHDPRLALDGGTDGLDFYRRLAQEAAAFLKDDGQMMLELGFGQAEAAQKIFIEQKWIVESVKADYSGHPRLLIVRKS